MIAAGVSAAALRIALVVFGMMTMLHLSGVEVSAGQALVGFFTIRFAAMIEVEPSKDDEDDEDRLIRLAAQPVGILLIVALNACVLWLLGWPSLVGVLS